MEIQGWESTPRNRELKPTCTSEMRLEMNGESNPGERESLQGVLFCFLRYNWHIRLRYTTYGFDTLMYLGMITTVVSTNMLSRHTIIISFLCWQQLIMSVVLKLRDGMQTRAKGAAWLWAEAGSSHIGKRTVDTKKHAWLQAWCSSLRTWLLWSPTRSWFSLGNLEVCRGVFSCPSGWHVMGEDQGG